MSMNFDRRIRDQQPDTVANPSGSGDVSHEPRIVPTQRVSQVTAFPNENQVRSY